nr:hypothetical protein [Streptomyces caatingaensis]
MPVSSCARRALADVAGIHTSGCGPTPPTGLTPDELPRAHSPYWVRKASTVSADPAL